MTGSTRLDPQLRTVGELFDDSDVVYTIPVYQRNFAWRAEQIEQLIDDVWSAAQDPDQDQYFPGQPRRRRTAAVGHRHDNSCA